MQYKSIVLDENAIKRTLKRMSHEIIEKNKGVKDVVLLGIQRRGVPIARRIAKLIEKFEEETVEVGSVDITLYRDDLTELSEQAIVRNANININVENKKIILVDDVLYTGRTARAALEAIIHQGRPSNIQLAVLIDRGHRELPIRADYVGKNVPTSRKEIIGVNVGEIDGEDSVKIYEA